MNRKALWGFHIDEYQSMFDLSDKQMRSNILEYGCAATAVNSQLAQSGHHNIISLDPWFGLDCTTLEKKINLNFEQKYIEIIRQKNNLDALNTTELDTLLNYRRAGIKCFLQDYDRGCAEKRYVECVDIATNFVNNQFNHAVSSHFFFDHSGAIKQAVERICELVRVANEVRIFPLNDLNGTPSPGLAPVLLGLQQLNYGIEIRHVPSQLCAQGNAMLRVWSQTCALPAV